MSGRETDSTERGTLLAAVETFLSTKELADGAIRQLDDVQLETWLVPDGNSVSTLMRHIAGNMRSRWTDFLHSDGEKPWRQRDEEFEAGKESRQEQLDRWEAGWQCLFAALDDLVDEDLQRVVRIRGKELTVARAIHRQQSHYGYHVGQIVLLARTLCDSKWASLSIPRGDSATYNRSIGYSDAVTDSATVSASANGTDAATGLASGADLTTDS